jgi:hypothetical protein
VVDGGHAHYVIYSPHPTKTNARERDALKADVKDLAARVKEMESQLQAFSEQSASW